MTSRLESFETELLTEGENLAGLAALNRQLIARVAVLDSPRRVVLDMHNTEWSMASRSTARTTATSSPPAITRCCCSTAKATAWQRKCAGQCPRAEGWEELLLPDTKNQQQRGKEVVFRADAAFAKPGLYAAPEARNVKYAIRLPSNAARCEVADQAREKAHL